MSNATISPDLQSKLDKAARLQRRIRFRNDGTKQLEKRLATLKAEIAVMVPAVAGLESKPTDSGGKSFRLAAATGATVRVTQPAAKLLSKIAGELVGKLRNLCGETFSRLFVTHYTCAANIRQLAYELLPKDDARQLIALVEEPARATVTIE